MNCDQHILDIPWPGNSAVLPRLPPGVSVTVYLVSVNDANLTSLPSERLQLQTLKELQSEKIPGELEVAEVRLVNKSATMLTLEWDPPTGHSDTTIYEVGRMSQDFMLHRKSIIGFISTSI